MNAIRTPTLWRRLLAELLGSGLLVTVVVGSGIAASRLSPGEVGLQLLENSTATALGLAVLILVFGPTSGAHFNPLVTGVDWILGRRSRRGIELPAAVGYALAQVVGGILGALLADAMFGTPVAIATTERESWPHLLGEVVATAGLVLLVFTLARTASPAVTAAAVGGYIGSAYWFTSSTSFANPAVTIGRLFSDSFAGIAPGSVLPFIAAQVVGAAVGVGLLLLLHPSASRTVDRVTIPAARTE
jgi:glycerol uptake facilitator-like aquaporin